MKNIASISSIQSASQIKGQQQRQIRLYFSKKREHSAKIIAKNSLNLNANPFSNIYVGSNQQDMEQLMEKYKLFKGKIKKPSVLKYYFPEIKRSKQLIGKIDGQVQMSKSRNRGRVDSFLPKSIQSKKFYTIDQPNEKRNQKHKIRMNFSEDQVQRIRNQVQGQLQSVRKKRFLPFGASKARNLEIIMSKKSASPKFVNFDQQSTIQQIFSKKKKLNDYQNVNQQQLQSKISSCTLEQSIYHG